MEDRNTREAGLLSWYRDWSGEADASLEVVSGDASFRRYFRAQGASGPVVLVDSPPDKEKNPEFVAIAAGLAASGIRVPRVLQFDLDSGYMALEDLGDQVLLPLLNASSVDHLYTRAMAVHADLAAADRSLFELPVYDRVELTREMDLFADWFCPQLLGLKTDDTARRVYADLRDVLCDRAIAQQQVVVHRDFHARNFMVLDGEELALIDFQDAIVGPITYDLVSLLKDCYLRWPADRVRSWALQQRDALVAQGFSLPEADDFVQDFDWMGLQRHIKVLGIFSRLYLRDGKSTYLGDLPRVMAYVREALAAYPQIPELAAFLDWFDGQVAPAARTQPWFDSEMAL